MNADILKELFRSIHEDESGATATEYIILLILVACFIIAIVKTFGQTVEHKYADANNVVDRQLTF
jgi:Flp pilus assembly pilin Flp